jgi:diaminopimelate decarboxylase
MSAPPFASSSAPAFVDPSAFTPHFSWKSRGNARSESRGPRRGADGEHRGQGQEQSREREDLFCENLRLADVAERYGTPTYLYSGAAITDAYRELHRGLRDVPHTLCFAVKSNSNLAILQRLANLGSGFDIVSGGELYRLAQIGVPGKRIVFSGVGKTREEIREALQYRAGKRGSRAGINSSGSRNSRRAGNSGSSAVTNSGVNSGILLFNIESEAELEVLLEESSRAARRGAAAPATAIRVNPDVAAGGHPHISTGRHDHKFGLDWLDAKRLYLAHRASKHIRWRGISTHIGSQIVALDPFRDAFSRLTNYVEELRGAGIDLQYLDIGGGLGTRYTDEEVATRINYAAMVARAAKPLGLHVLLEPGRSIIAAAGVLLTRVIYTKTNRGRKFVVVDAAMNDLMRPALYDATHPITRAARTNSSEHATFMGERAGERSGERVDIVGPVCETGDSFLRDWALGGEVRPGEVLVIWTAGAYGMAQSSNYNARCRAAEVLAEGRRTKLIRRRETRKDLLRHDIRQ